MIYVTEREKKIYRIEMKLKIAIKKEDALSVAILLTRIKNLGFKVEVCDD